MSLLIVGSIALDTVKTPFGDKTDVLGGSAVYSAVAASFFSPVNLSGVVGDDFPGKHLEYLKSRSIDLKGLKTLPGPTFRWSGYYEYDMNQAHTVDTRLNVYGEFNPQLPEEYRDAEYVFLANINPELQLKVLSQLKHPKLIVMDTMNYWIEKKREALHEVIKRVDFVLMNDGEAREFMETPSLPMAARRLLKLGAKSVIIKKGEHGALWFSDSTHFSASSYPQEALRDPTGAGDSFAGGFMGYLNKTKDLSEENIRKAVVMGSVMASFNIEDFSLDRMKRLSQREILERFEEFKRFSEFEALLPAHWS